MLIFFLSIILGDVAIEVTCIECMIFDQKHGYKISEKFQTVKARSRVICAFQCFREPKCKTASFNKVERSCDFSELSFGSAEITPGDGCVLLLKQGKITSRILFLIRNKYMYICINNFGARTCSLSATLLPLNLNITKFK